jgi:murein DD-endopeptidase MepM/ murein hydrolase activator NlpD
MQIFFPTYILAEGAEYRPPLYPIPWALTAHDHFFFARPIAASYPSDPYADYTYGSVYFGPDSIHTGVDLPAPRNTEVMAAGPGTVVWSGIGLYSGSPYNLNDPYGIAVAIRHDFGYQDQPLYTVYAHLAESDVAVGQWLETGDVLGNVGTTGMTTGPHLHFEVRLGKNDYWSTRNPELWVAPPLGYGVLVGRIMNTAGFLLDSHLVTVTSLDTKRSWYTYTYAKLTIHRDPHFDENVVFGSLPAGIYELNIPYGSLNRKVTFEILPGQINYFGFQGRIGYQFGDSALPTPTPVP